MELQWGVYRTDPSQWQHPEGIILPEGSHLDPITNSIISPLNSSSNNNNSTKSCELTVPNSLAPLTLAFVVKTKEDVVNDNNNPTKPKYLRPFQGKHFSILLGTQSGTPAPLGPSLGNSKPMGSITTTTTSSFQQQHQQHDVNFAVKCKGAEYLTLVLIRPPQQEHSTTISTTVGWKVMEVALDPVLNRTGDTWHICLPGLKYLEGLYYGWRVKGDLSWEQGHRISPDAVLLDPYAPHLAYIRRGRDNVPDGLKLPVVVDVVGEEEGEEKAIMALSSLAGLMEKASIQRCIRTGEKMNTKKRKEEVVAVEVDVRTFASTFSGAAVKLLNTIHNHNHSNQLDINTVILTPPYATSKGMGPIGRASVSFMAPDPSLSTNPADPLCAASEFKDMVSKLQQAGVKVLISFDLAFTAEGSDTAPTTLSLRGLDNGGYYRPNGVLNCGRPAVAQLALSALRNWAEQYAVDGFCFLNAENMVQDRDGFFLDAPPMAEAIVKDPVLSGLMMVAQPGDDPSLLPRGGVRGFPHWGLWRQRNTAFTADLYSYFIDTAASIRPGYIGGSGGGGEGEEGRIVKTVVGAMAQRLSGSADLFDAAWDQGFPGSLASSRTPAHGLNSAAILSKTTSTGSSNSFKDIIQQGVQGAIAEETGYGCPPPPTDPTSLASTIAKSMLAVSILSLGTPVLSQDVLEDATLTRFVEKLLHLRSTVLSSLLYSGANLSSSTNAHGVPNRVITWHGAPAGTEPDWQCSTAHTHDEGGGGGSRDAGFLGMCITESGDDAVYIGINPHGHIVGASIPPPPAGHSWLRCVDTSRPSSSSNNNSGDDED